MGASKKSPWVLGTVVLGALLLAAAWLLLISPRMEAAAGNRAQAETEQSRIDTLEIQLAGLEADFARIDEFRADLSALREQVPTRVEMSLLTRQLDTLAAQSGVGVLNVSSLSPVLVTVVDQAALDQAAAAEAAAAGEVAADGDAAEPTTDSSSEPPPPAAPTTAYYAVPLTITTYGDYANTLSFIAALQTENPRLVLVVDIQATGIEPAGSTGGRPAVGEGALETRLSAYALVMPVPAVEPADGEGDAQDDARLPVPAGSPNPFLPLG